METNINIFKNKRILVLGDCILDKYVVGDCTRISPEAPVPVLSVNSSFEVAGGAANTASNITSLGAECTLIGCIGDDNDGNTLIHKMYEQGIIFRAFKHHLPTISKTRMIAQNQQLLRIDLELIQPLNSKMEHDIYLQFIRDVVKCDVVIISDYGKGFFSEQLCQKIISYAHKENKQVIVDPCLTNNYYKNCDYITPSWKEAQADAKNIYDLCNENDTESYEYVSGIINTFYNTNVLLTLGENGIYFLSKDKKESFTLPTEAKQVFDVSGAGDTVVAVFALCLVSGYSMHDAIRTSNKAAGIVVGKLGTSTVTHEELFGQPVFPKIVHLNDLDKLSKVLRKCGKSIVTCNGVFDMFHSGHLHFLKEANMQGDILIVGINSDVSVKLLKPNRPIIQEKARSDIIAALGFVDYVYIFDEETPINSLAIIKPDVHVNGASYGEKCIESEVVKRIYLVNKLGDDSTTNIIEKIKKEK